MDNELVDLINTIKRIKSANQFPNYIDYIQFPFFRNIEIDQRINFDFPLTAFIGPNGSGKSSTLHALYGCPEGRTPYEFWFSTPLDTIDYFSSDGRKLRQSFFYSYKDETGEELQVIKARINRENNPDYWETSRPLIVAGMKEIPEGKRNPPIKKNVVYFDFRSELSAFDKYFYYETLPSNLRSRTRQDYLRNRSKKLRNLFAGNYDKTYAHGVAQNKDLENLDANEIKMVSDILTKNYNEIKIIYHKLFHNWGNSILVKTNFHKYSEAFAGSGEMSVIRLVHGLLKATEGSLVLLDEPEVSLHPGAQKGLKQFLLEQIKIKKHQIVVSTHSPTFVEFLPKEAIKIFSQNLDNGKINIKENISSNEAFYFIGHKINNKINLVVEDILAQKILEKILQAMGEHVNNRFVVKFLPGGANALQQHIASCCNMNIDNCFFIFDGDQKRVNDLFNVELLTDLDKNVNYLKNKIIEQTGSEIKFYIDGGVQGGNQEQLVQMMITYLRYFKNHVYYLSAVIPEDIIWSDDIVQQKLNSQDYERNITQINSWGSSKQKMYETSKILFGVETQIDAFEDMLINEWIKKEDENYFAIKNIIESLSIEYY